VTDRSSVEFVNQFKYLGAWISSDGICDAEIRMRNGMTKDAHTKIEECLTN